MNTNKMKARYRNVFKFEDKVELKATWSTVDIDWPPMRIHGCVFGETVEVLHKLPKCWQLWTSLRIG